MARSSMFPFKKQHSLPIADLSYDAEKGNMIGRWNGTVRKSWACMDIALRIGEIFCIFLRTFLTLKMFKIRMKLEVIA